MVRIQAQPTNIVVIQVYMPTSAHSDEEVEAVYEKLEQLSQNVKGTEYLIVMGDWNAVVGEQKEENCVGEFGLGRRNDRGQRLIEFCKQQKMVVTNTCFKQEKRRRYTWKAPGDTERYQLDYIMVRQRYRNSVKNSHAYPGADADTDHNLVMMTAFLTLKNVKCKKKNIKRWDRENINTRGTEFAEAVDKQLIKGNNNMTTAKKWKNLKCAMTTQAKRIIGYKKGIPAKKPWITQEMIEKMAQRRKFKHQCDERSKKEYRRLNNELRRETDKARKKWWEEQCDEIEDLQKQGKHAQVYSKIRQLQKRKCKSGTEIKDRHGNLLKNGDQIRSRWKEYIEELYDKENAPTVEEMSNKTQQASSSEDEMGPSILKEEINQAIKEMKRGKAEGIDCIPAEFLKTLGEKAKGELVEICQQIYETGKWPEDFLRTVMVPLKKKSNATECSDHRNISLVVYASKIRIFDACTTSVNILTKRIESKVATTNYIGEDQYGFRKGKGTRYAIAVLRCLGARSLEHGKDL